ncbi:MAG: hypothetical protein Kapaf2KO_13150 [Candidatus Kapaibacteriales bacterium]
MERSIELCSYHLIPTNILAIARKNQSIQDWLTQQWVILFGEKIDSKQHEWLLGPFGDIHGIGIKFIEQLANDESLEIDKQTSDKGLLNSINDLGLTEDELTALSTDIIDFYENTSDYNLLLNAKWNPFFKIFGFLLKFIFSSRIEQLNIPIRSLGDESELTNEIIKLIDPNTGKVKRTIWLRTFKSNG